MIQTIRKAWGIPELRKKIIFTALILLIFRIGNAIPVPYVNTGLLVESEGFGYARYAAFIPEKSALSLEGIPTERASEKCLCRHPTPER